MSPFKARFSSTFTHEGTPPERLGWARGDLREKPST